MKNKNAFTLVELMISISIIAILSVVLSVSFSKAQKDGRDQRRIEDLKAMQNAAEQMVMLSGTYPPSAGSYNNLLSGWTINGQVILQKIPADPKYSTTNIGATYIATGVSSAGYCVCGNIEVSKNANSGTNSCGFASLNNCLNGLSSCYFCVKNQQ